MYCPQCHHPNPADAQKCVKCKHTIDYLRERVFIGRQFIFVQADQAHPVALQVDQALQTFSAPAILSRHQHAVAFGEASPRDKSRLRQWPLSDQPRLSPPSLQLLTVITDRKIYKPATEAAVFIVAPDAAQSNAALEIHLAGQKVYEAQVALNQDGLALHRYADLKEGEYTARVTLPGNAQAECTFSVAEFTLSPLIATLEKHEYAQQHLKFTLKLLLLSAPYSGEVEFGLQCQVCGEQVVATQKTQAKDGSAHGDFDLSGHGGPFHVQITTPDGNTALVSFPGTGAVEREHIRINPLGQAFEAGLLPWQDAEPVRGFYIGPGAMNMTPVLLESVHAPQGKLQIASDLSSAQLVTFNPLTNQPTNQLTNFPFLKRGETIEFDIDAPYTLFTFGAFTKDKPFEGWGIVIKPVAFEAQLTAPKTAQPGKEIEIAINVERSAVGVFCLLLVYDARLEHESPIPKLARRIYESMRDASGDLASGQVADAASKRGGLSDDFVLGAPPPLPAMMKMAAPDSIVYRGALMTAGAEPEAMPVAEAVAEAPTMVVAPTRMEFPELAYIELFYLEGEAARTVRLGDQIGTWRARAYVFQGVDYRELTADIQADKPLYAELDLPAIASIGDDITAAVNYYTREPAELVITSFFGETRHRVQGAGVEHLAIKGPGRVEVRLENPSGADWSLRDVAPPGVQKVTASRLMILDKGQTAQGEKVVVYATLGQVLKDTITALIHYPFG